MSKVKIAYVCQSCGYKNPKWLGRCPECNELSSLIEEVERQEATIARPILSNDAPSPIRDINPVDNPRLSVGIPEIDRVLGGGVVLGSVALIGGDPGIGKSTLILQALKGLTKMGKVLYVSGEESP